MLKEIQYVEKKAIFIFINPSNLHHHHHHHHQYLNHQGRRGTAWLNGVPTVSISCGRVRGLGSLQRSFLSNLLCCLPTFSSVCLVSSSLGLSLGGWSLIMCWIVSHVHTTSTFASSLLSGGLHSASHVWRWFSALLRLWCGLCTICRGVLSSASDQHAN